MRTVTGRVQAIHWNQVSTLTLVTLLVLSGTVATVGVAPASATPGGDLNQFGGTGLDDWPTPGHDPGRSGHSDDGAGPATDVDARWVYEAENDTHTQPAVVADGRVFVPTRDGLQVLDNETGAVLWTSHDVNVEHVVVSDGVAVVASEFDNEVRAFDATTGTELWNVTSFEARGLVAANGTVYVERYYYSQDYVRLYAFDLQDGTEQWSVQHADDVGGGLAADGETVYATWKLSDSWDREYGVFAMNASSGEIRWQFEVEGRITMHPVVVDDRVYVGAGGEVVNGGERYDPKLYALDATDGHVDWIFDAHARPDGAAVAEETVFVSMGNGVHALDLATGERQWIHRMNGDIDYGLSYERMTANPPAVADGVVYATNDRGFVDALDANTGSVLWTYRIAGRATEPAIADGRLYVHAPVTSNDDVVRVYALEVEPFAFSGLTPSTTVAAPGEPVSVDVTVENVDDETRTYDLSLMAEGVFPEDRRAVDSASGQLNPGQSETVTFETGFDTTGSWDLSVERATEDGASTGSVTVDVVHPASVDDWPIRDFDRGATDANANTEGPKRTLQERWNVSNYHDSYDLVVANDTVFAFHERSYDPRRYSLAAYDFESGASQWEYNFSDDHRIPRGSPTISDGTAYVYATSSFAYGDGAPDPVVGTVYAIDVADGTVTWSNDVLLNRSTTADQAPVVADGRVYVAGAITEENSDHADAFVYALNATTGSVDWTHGYGADDELEQFYTLAYDDGTLFATLSDETDPAQNVFDESVVAIDAATGGQVWKRTSQNLDLSRHVVTRDGLVYVIDRPDNGNGGIAEEIVAYDAADGTEAWRFTPPNVTTSSNEYDQWSLFKPVVTEDALYVYQRETQSTYHFQRLNRVNASTGELEWRRSYSDRGSFVVVDGLVYASGYNDRTAIYHAATGEALGSTDTSSGANGAVEIVVDGTIFGTTDQGQTLRALSKGGHFEFSDLAVASERVGLGENATITATVTNVGELERSWNVNLLVAPSSDRQDHHVWNYRARNGRLGPGESETVTWDVRLDERGDYVFTLQPNYENTGMSAYLDDLTHGITVSAGDGRDGETIDFVGPREMPDGPDVWPKEGYDAGNTGNNSDTTAPISVGGDTVAWSVNHTSEWTSGPTVANDTLFVGGTDPSGGEYVYAYDATNGEERWKYLTFVSRDVEVPPTYAGGYVYTAAIDGRVYQFDATTGERLWTYNGLGDVTGIAVVDDVAYVSGYRYEDSNYLASTHALNASTREILWTFERVGPSYGPNSVPAVADGTVYVTSDDGNTYALDAATGTVVWSEPIAGSSSRLHSPVVEDGVVYVDDAAWDSTDANLYALNATDGSTIWSIPANVDGYTASSPALADGTLYFTADGAVRAVDATGDATGGNELWSTTICSEVRHSPVYAGGVVYVGTTDSTLRAYDADTGEQVWRYDGDDEYAFTPAVVDGVLYTTGLENDDYTYSLLALEGGPTDEPKPIFDYSGLSVSNEAVAVGESLTVSANVENLGDAGCDYAADLVIDGSVEDTATGSLGGESYNDDDTVEFTHSFASVGTYNVTIEDLPPIEVTVTESVADPVVSPTTRDFGDVGLGNSTDRYVQVTNEGTETLHLTGESITGTDAGDFSVLSVSQTTVYPDDSATIWMRFEPTSAGPKTATLDVTTTEGTVTAALTGTGVTDPPEILVTPTSVDFGDVAVGSTASETVTVENVGGSTLTFDNATLGISELDSFAVVAGNATTTLAPGETHDLTIEFSPPSASVDSTTLQVYSDDPDDPMVPVSLAGTGIDPEPTVQVSPEALNFGTVETGSNASANVTVSNDGQADLSVTGLTIAGEGSDDFSISTASPTFVLAPGESRNATVTFEPTAAEPVAGTLEIATNDTATPTAFVGLSGIGVEPPGAISVTPSTIEFGEVPMDENATETVVVSNVGAGNLTVTEAAVLWGSTAYTVTSGNEPVELAPNDTHEIAVTYEPTAIDPQSASLRITSDDPENGSVDVALNGSGYLEPGVHYDYLLESTTVDEGENVSMLVGVLNNQATSDTFNATVKLDGAVYTHWNGTVSPNVEDPLIETFNLSLSPGEYELTVNDLDATIVTVSAADPDPPTSPGGSGSGSGGGGAAPIPPADDEPAEPPAPSISQTALGGGGGFAVTLANADGNGSLTARFPDGSLGSDGLSLDALGISLVDGSGGDLQVTAGREAPTGTAPPDASVGDPLAYFDVAHPSLADEEVTGATFEFTVPRGMLEDRGVAPEDVVLVRHHDGEWAILETRLIDETAETYGFEASSPGLSVFAVVASGAQPADLGDDADGEPTGPDDGEPADPGEGTDGESADQEAADGTSDDGDSGQPGFGPLAVLLALLAAAGLGSRRGGADGRR